MKVGEKLSLSTTLGKFFPIKNSWGKVSPDFGEKTLVKTQTFNETGKIKSNTPRPAAGIFWPYADLRFFEDVFFFRFAKLRG